MSSNGAGAVDFAYLDGFLAGDRAVVLEVLGMFRDQAQGWRARLDSPDEDLAPLAHTIKGAARGVGARPLGDAAELVEFGGPAHLAGLRAALEAAIGEITAHLAQTAA